jgi:hypothetical protein
MPGCFFGGRSRKTLACESAITFSGERARTWSAELIQSHQGQLLSEIGDHGRMLGFLRGIFPLFQSACCVGLVAEDALGLALLR